VLTYHRVSPYSDGVFDPVSPQVFQQQVRHLARYYNVLTASEAAGLNRCGRLPQRAVCITFDDGYRDNYEYAFPILKQYGVRATVFVTTGTIDSAESPLWHDQVFAAFGQTRKASWEWNGVAWSLSAKAQRWEVAKRFAAFVRCLGESERDAAVQLLSAHLEVSAEEASQRSPMLTWDHIREMNKWGVEIGAHTVTHPVLSTLPAERQEQEIRDSIETIERQVGIRPRVFSYPNGRAGDFDDKSIELLKVHGVDAAYTTVFGTNNTYSDPFRLRRGAGWAEAFWRFAAQMIWYRLTT